MFLASVVRPSMSSHTILDGIAECEQEKDPITLSKVPRGFIYFLL